VKPHKVSPCEVYTEDESGGGLPRIGGDIQESARVRDIIGISETVRQVHADGMGRGDAPCAC